VSETDSAKEKPARSTRSRKTHADRALAGVRAARKVQGEITDPAERVRALLAEAHVLALLDVAAALAPPEDG
jgi:hypothetical protein